MKKILLALSVSLWIVYAYHLSPAGASDLRKDAVVRAVEQAIPAVVNISTEQEAAHSSPFGNFGDPSFDRFFRDFFEGPSGKYTNTSLGSGVLIRKDGYILTNEHVVLRASKITVNLLDGREFPAKVIGSDPTSDLAILKIDAGNLPIIHTGESADLMIGETVIAIGNPFGLSHTVTTGVVSALHRSFRTSQEKVYADFIQTDASINPGNSGGPLLNIDGELVGINSAIYGNAQGIGFAIPIDRAQRIVSNLIDYGKVRHGWIGLRLSHITPEVASRTGVRPGQGVLVTHVFGQSPAAKSGLLIGDVVVGVGQMPVGSVPQYKSAIMSVTVGTNVSLDLVRNGKKFSQTLTASELPISVAKEFSWDLLGVNVEENSKALAAKYKLKTVEGMVVTRVKVNSPAGRLGMEPGDVLLAIGDKSLKTTEDFHVACASLRLAQSAVIVVQRRQRAYYLSVRLN